MPEAIKDIVTKYKGETETFIAYNECFYMWQYDSKNRYALLYGDITKDYLRLVIIDIQVKLGQYQNIIHDKLIDKKVGTFEIPDLKSINYELMTNSFERGKASRPFSKLWYKGLSNITTPLGEYIKEVYHNTPANNTQISTPITPEDNINFDFSKAIEELNNYIDSSFRKINDELQKYNLDSSRLVPMAKKIRLDFDDFVNELNNITK